MERTRAPRPEAVVVCPVVPHPPVSGGQKRTLRLLEAIERAGARPHVVTPDASAPAGVDALRGLGWPVDVVPAGPPSAAARLRQHVRRLPAPWSPALALRVGELAPRAAFVQLEHTQSAPYLRGPRAVLSLHNVDSEVLAALARERRAGTLGHLRAWNLAAATRTTERRAAPRAALVACVSDDDALVVERLGGRPCVAPNGVDDALLALPAAQPAGESVLFFGALDYPPNRLGLERFLDEGWPSVLERRPAARLAVAGSGTDARLAGIPGVDVLGLVDDIGEALAAARVVLAPLWHGGGTRLKVVEALAAARPVVGTPLGVGGTGLADGVHGLVGDTPGDLAAATVALLGDPARAAVLGRSGRGLAEGLRWSTTLAPLEDAYRAMVGVSSRS